MGVQRLLDLAGVHVVAAADDELLLPVDEVEVSVSRRGGRHRRWPASRPGRSPRASPPSFVPVAGDDRRSAELDLADARSSGSAIRSSVVAERLADRPGLPRVARRVYVVAIPRHLGEAVAFDELAAERSLEVVGDLVRDGGAADVRDPDGRQRRAPSGPPGRARCTSSGRRAGSSSASRSSVASVPSPSNRRSTAIEPPRRIASRRTPVTSPRTCENGAAPSTTSSGPKAIASAAAAAAVADAPVREDGALRPARTCRM